MLKYTKSLAELKLLTHFNNHLPIVWVQYQEHQRREGFEPVLSNNEVFNTNALRGRHFAL